MKQPHRSIANDAPGTAVRARRRRVAAIWACGLLAGPAAQGGVVFYDDATRLVETAICTTTHKGPADPARPLSTGNPLDQMMSLPTTCLLTGLGALERRDGIKGLMANGWRPAAVSHQIVPMPVAQSGGDRVELLLSLVVILQRVSPTPLPISR